MSMKCYKSNSFCIFELYELLEPFPRNINNIINLFVLKYEIENIILF